MQELVFARHGLAHCNVAGIVGGPRGCTGLTERGRAQAARLGAHLCRGPVTGLHTGPRRRVRETAEIVAAALGVPARVDERLAEPRLGPSVDGRRWVDVRAELGLGQQEFPVGRIADGGESWAEFVARVAAALADITTQHGRTVVVGHVETVLAIHQILGGEARPIGNAAMTVWWRRSPGGSWRLVYRDDSRHLVPE